MEEKINYKQRLGRLGEELAALYLQQRGYRILERNFRIRTGEIDLIASVKDEIHFIEVKTRTSQVYGAPCESVTERKKAHIRNTAAYYMAGVAEQSGCGREHRIRPEQNCQFDVLEIQLNHLKNAF